MEVPYVQVILTSTSKQNEIDRTFRLDAVNRSIKVGRASSRSSCADSALDDNCYLKSPIVSRNHGRFIIGDKAHPLKLVDDGSAHGTFVNDLKLLPNQEFVLENNSKVTFANEIIHGKANYRPTIFRVSFIWHDPVIPDTFPTIWATRPGIRAPTPESDSEDEENNGEVNTHTPYARSPSVIVLDSPPCIDLTGDVVSDSGHRSTDQDVSSTIAHHEDESTGSLWKNSNQENDAIVKETNIPSMTTKRFYRFDYADSDPEDGVESTSQSSPPARDFDSLYDDSDDSDVPSSLQSPQSVEKESNKDDMSDQEGEVEVEKDEGETQSENSQQIHNKDDSSETDIVDGTEDVLDESHSELYTIIGNKTLTSYERSLQWLGASEHDNAEAIVELFGQKINADSDVQNIALECIQVIADETPDEDLASKLEHWLDTGNLPEFEIETESECRDSYNLPTSSEHIAIELPSVPAMPPASRTSLTSQTHVSECGPSLFTTNTPEGFPALATSIFPSHHVGFRDLSFSSAPIWPNYNTEPSPIMHISNLVDRVSADSYPTTSSIPLTTSNINPTFTELRREQPDQHSKTSSKAATFDESDRELPTFETVAFGEQKELEAVGGELEVVGKAIEVVREELKVIGEELGVVREEPSFNLESASAGQKRKLGDTDLEEQEDVSSGTPATSNVPTSSSSPPQGHLHQVWSYVPTPGHPNGSDNLQSVPNITDNVSMVEDNWVRGVVGITKRERGQPQRQKRKISAESHPRPSLLKTIATHCIAGAVGAIGLVAAIVATTPAQLKEELLYQKA